MRLRAIALVAVTSIAGLGLVGAGAHASLETGKSSPSTFSTTVAPRCDDGRNSKDRCDDDSGWPPIAVQNLSVVLSANGATGNGTSNLTLSSLGPTGSSFMTTPTLITITNNGNMTATGVALQLTDHNNNTTLKDELWVCLHSNGGIFFNNGGISFNERLTMVEGYGQVAIGNLALAPGATSSYTIVYYAGTSENTGCGNAFTGYHALVGGGYFGKYSTSEPYPSGTTNSAATSLTNPAEGESITPTVTVSYLGSPTLGTITQVAPLGKSVTVPNSGGAFSDQLAVTGSSGAVTYVVPTSSSNTHLKVSPSGAITTVGGPLAVGTYTVSGTDSDALGDTGTWAYTLRVTNGTITCTGSHGGEVHWSHWGDFNDQLSETGAHGTPTYTITSSDDHLHISSDGRITTDGGHLPAGTYTISGNCKDSYGDTGTWSYTLTVSK